MTDIKKAYKLAEKLHSGYRDRGGSPYFNHIKRVFKGVGGFNAKPESLGIVALLHDIVEDTKINIREIEKVFGKEVSLAVKAITKKPSASYKSYLSNVKSNRLAKIVKIADLKDNINLKRISNPNEDDYARTEIYKKALDYLS